MKESAIESNIIEKASQAIVVGHNIDALRFLLSAARTYPGVNLKWFRTALDAAFESKAKDFGEPWVVLPSLWTQRGDLNANAVPKNQSYVFYTPLKRVSISEFSARGNQLLNIHPSLVNKILAVALGNDLSPSPMGEKHSKFYMPDVAWHLRKPVTLEVLENDLNVYLGGRAQCLEQGYRDLEALRVNVLHEAKVVTGVRPSSHKGDEHQIVHNAPYEPTLAQKVLWTGMSMPMRQGEGSSSALFAESDFELAVARWRSYCAKVPLQQVTALPVFSVWIDPVAARDFLETGRVGSGFLKRVFCIPTRDQKRAWLQVDTFEWLGASHRPKDLADNAFKILRWMCPNLAITESVEYSLDENYFFKDPKARFFRMGRDIDYWFSGSLGEPSQVMNQWIVRSKVEKPASSVDKAETA